MKDQWTFEKLGNDCWKPHVQRGPLLHDFLSSASRHINETGGYEVARSALSLTPATIIQSIEEAGLRGRGGGGFPTGHKWKLVAESAASERYFICNANAGQPGGFKERFLLRTNPHRIIESLALAAIALNATTAIVFLPQHFGLEARLLEEALQEASANGLVGENAFGLGRPLNIAVYRAFGRYITGEETALMELVEGRVGRPRGKPPLPVSRGLFGAPTAINNLETLLHIYYIVKHGARKFREIGTRYSPGSLVFSVSGHVQRPGLYELPLGTTLRELIFHHAQGIASGAQIKMVLPGGVSSPVVTESSLDLPLDYDSAYDARLDLGSGTVIVTSKTTSAVTLARCLSVFFHEKSCGKCRPCEDGTRRTMLMLNRLESLDQTWVDTPRMESHASSQPPSLKVLNNPTGVGYTDNVQGLDKIRQLCEFYKYRGDCHHSMEAANSIQRLLELFPSEFEKYSNNCNGDSNGGATNGS
jgi:NADH-quinone oxidoreductase subunit F